MTVPVAHPFLLSPGGSWLVLLLLHPGPVQQVEEEEADEEVVEEEAGEEEVGGGLGAAGRALGRPLGLVSPW